MPLIPSPSTTTHGNILAQEQYLAALTAEPLCQALAGADIHIGQHDTGFFAHKKFCFRCPLPACGSRDQRHLARQSRHFLASARCDMFDGLPWES
jgi:hypothetical protein